MRELREALPGEPSQATMAAKLPGNVQGAEWSRWETGRHRPHSDTLDEIAKILNTTAADLMLGPMAARDEPKTDGHLFDDLSAREAAAPPGTDATSDAKLDFLIREVRSLRAQQAKLLARLASAGSQPQDQRQPKKRRAQGR